MLDVSRQMISSLENGRCRMTRMQYLAIRQVLEDEIRRSAGQGSTQMLEDLLLVLVDEPERFTPEERERVLADANMLAPSIVSKKTTRKHASTVWASVLAGVGIALAAAALTGGDPEDHKPKDT